VNQLQTFVQDVALTEACANSDPDVMGKALDDMVATAQGLMAAWQPRCRVMPFGYAPTAAAQGLTLVTTEDGTEAAMVAKYRSIDCVLVPGGWLSCHGIPAVYQWAIFRSVTMSKAHAMHVANFVNDHDDGTAQPRARAVPRGTHWLVEIKSTEVTDGGDLVVVTDLACSLSEAKDVLGY
jgi:hypothetical protein